MGEGGKVAGNEGYLWILVVGGRGRALNRVNDKMALFGVRSPIEIPSTPRSGIG